MCVESSCVTLTVIYVLNVQCVMNMKIRRIICKRFQVAYIPCQMVNDVLLVTIVLCSLS